jgi:chromosome partitioning protein
VSEFDLPEPEDKHPGSPMRVLVLASQKGGSGKTTLSGHMAVEAERAGLGPVALIDTDPQGSLAQWWNARAESAPYFAQVGVLDLGDALAHLKKSGVRLAVIDTPPAITDSIAKVVAHADLVLVPTRPSPHDLRAVGATVDIAERFDKHLVFVINAATPRARITGEAAIALSQHGTVAPVMLHHRVDFAASMTDGRTVGETVPKSQSAKEVRDLWLYVQDRLARLAHDPQLAPQTRPEHFSVDALNVSDEKDIPAENVVDELVLDEPVEALPPPEVIVVTVEKPPFPDGIDRRAGGDRRQDRGVQTFGNGERRTHAFGRRATDRVAESGGAQ